MYQTRFTRLQISDVSDGELCREFRNAVWDQRTRGPLIIVDEPYDFSFWGYAMFGRFCVIDHVLPETVIASLPGKALSNLIEGGGESVIETVCSVQVKHGIPEEDEVFVYNRYESGLALLVKLDREVDERMGIPRPDIGGMEFNGMSMTRKNPWNNTVVRVVSAAAHGSLTAQTSPDPTP